MSQVPHGAVGQAEKGEEEMGYPMTDCRYYKRDCSECEPDDGEIPSCFEPAFRNCERCGRTCELQDEFPEDNDKTTRVI